MSEEDDPETLRLVINGLRMRATNLQRQLEERDELANSLRAQVLRVVEESENATAHCHTLKHVQKGLLAQISGRDELLAGLRQENEQLRRRLTTMDTQCEAVPRSDEPSHASGRRASSHSDGSANPEGSTDGSKASTASHDHDSGSGGAAVPQDEAATGAGGGEGAQATTGGGSGVDMLKRHNRELLRDLALCRRELGKLKRVHKAEVQRLQQQVAMLQAQAASAAGGGGTGVVAGALFPNHNQQAQVGASEANAPRVAARPITLAPAAPAAPVAAEYPTGAVGEPTHVDDAGSDKPTRSMLGTLLDTMLWPFSEISAVLSEAVSGADETELASRQHASSGMLRV